MATKTDKKKLRATLEDALTKYKENLEKYKATPTREMFDEKISKVNWHKDTAVMFAAYNPETEGMEFFSLKAMPTDVQAMCLYALHQAVKYDPAMCMVGVSTLIRQQKLNEVFAQTQKPENVDGEPANE